MKKLISLLLIFSITIFACTGDCFSCHQGLLKNLEKDKKHLPMKTCSNCHSPNPQSMAECGPDCFSCHPKEKLEDSSINEHKPIAECRSCHMKQQNLLKLNATKPFSESFLIDALKR